MDKFTGGFIILWLIYVIISLGVLGFILWAVWLAVDKFLLS